MTYMIKCMSCMVFSLLFISCGGDQEFYQEYQETIDVSCIISSTGGGYIVGCQAYDEQQGLFQGLIMLLDSNGNEKWTKEPNGISQIFALVLSDTSSPTALCSYEEPGKESQMCLQGYSSQGNLLLETIFTEMPSSAGRGLISTSDGGYLAVGSAGRQESQQGLIVKYKPNGLISWSRTYEGGQLSFFSNVIEITGGYVAIGSSIEGDNTNAWVLHIDSVGIALDSRILNLDFESTGHSIIHSELGYAALCGTSARDHVDPVVVFLDSNLCISRTFNYGASSLVEFPSHIASFPNGNILVGVTRFNGDQNGSGVNLFEINTRGDVIRQREIAPQMGYLIPMGILIQPNSCITVCGNYSLPNQGYTSGNGFVLKTNNNWEVLLSNN